MNYIQEVWVYLGVYKNNKNRKGFEWRDIEGLTITGTSSLKEVNYPTYSETKGLVDYEGQPEISKDRRLYDKRLFKIPYAHIGEMFLVYRPEDDLNSYMTGGEYIPASMGFYPDKELVTTWQAKSRAIEKAIANAQSKKKELSRNFVYEALEPIRAAYQELRAEGRRQLLADILRYVTTGRK